MEIIAVIAVLLLVVIVAHFTSRQPKKSQDSLRALEAMEASEYATNFTSGNAIGFNYQSGIVGIATKSARISIPFNQIISVEIVTDGHTVTKTNRGGQLAGAAVGGLAFGGVGAIIGGLSGSTSARKTVSKIAMNIITTSPDQPYVEFAAYQGTPIRADGPVYLEIERLLMPCYGRLRAIMETSSAVARPN